MGSIIKKRGIENKTRSLLYVIRFEVARQQAQELKNLALYIMEPMLLMDMNQKTQL